MSEVSLVAPIEATHLAPLSTMLAGVWQDDPDFYRDGYLGNSHYDWQVSRIALLGEDIVSHWGVWGYDMRVGSILLKTGGVGAVATREDRRKQGLMTRAGQRSLEVMRRAGYDLSVLHGYTRHYARFGYVRAWTYTDVAVRTDALPIRQPLLPLTPVDLSRNGEATVLYNRTHAEFTGTAVRPTYHNLTGRRAYSWAGPRGELVGYVRVERREGEPVLHCLEAVGEVEPSLTALRQVAEQDGCERVVFETLPARHPLLGRLRRGTAKETTRFEEGNGWMVRTVNLTRALDKLRGELCARLSRSSFADWTGNLLLSDGRETASLMFEDTSLHVVPGRPSQHQVLGGETVAQLLIGTDDPLEVAGASAMTLTGNAPGLIEVLFPAQQPSLAAWDQI